VNIFIAADMKDRVERVCQNKHIGEEEARKMIERADDKRASYYNYYTGKTWGGAASYDLCINSSILGIEETQKYIEAFIRKALNMEEKG
jgi:cytidylate kinase